MVSNAARELVAQIEAATIAGNAGQIRLALARCATGVINKEFAAVEAEIVVRAGRKANKAMRDAGRRMELIAR
jgi:hypothetical protein